jgi:hypothetical protein
VPDGLEHGHVGPEGAVNRRAYLPYAVLALATTAYLYPFLRVLWRVGDEGTLVYGAQRVAEGAVPYRDFFEVMGPGTFYWLGFFFKILGANWLVARALLMVTAVATTLIIYWLARRLDADSGMLPAIFLLALTFPLWPATSHHWDSNLFALLSFAAFITWLENDNGWLLIAAGILAALTTFFMQQKGALLLFAYLVILALVQRRRPDFLTLTTRLLAAYSGVVLVLVLSLYAAGAVPEFVYDNFVWPITNYHNVNSTPYAFGLWESFGAACSRSMTMFFPPAVARVAASLLFAPVLVIAGLPLLLVLFGVAGRATAFNRSTLPYWIAGAALWVSEIHRADIPHLIYGSPLLLILCLHLWRQQQGKVVTYALRTLAVSVVVFTAFNALATHSAQTRTVTRRGTVYTFEKDAALDFLDSQTAAGEAVFVYPYYPMYYFLSATTNPTRFSILMYHINTDAQFREAIEALEQRKVRYVLWDTAVDGQNLKQWFPKYQHPSPDRLLMEPYLNKHYNLIGYKSGFRLLQRKDAAAAQRAEPASISPGP